MNVKPTPFDCLFKDAKEFKKAKERRNEIWRQIMNVKPTPFESSGLAKSIGHDAVEQFTRQVSGVLDWPQKQFLHQCIRDVVDDHLAPLMDELKKLVEGD